MVSLQSMFFLDEGQSRNEALNMVVVFDLLSVLTSDDGNNNSASSNVFRAASILLQVSDKWSDGSCSLC